MRTIRLIQQLQDVQATRNYFEALELAWDAHGNEEPCLLPDTGAKDGLCGEEWAVHAGEWARARGHQWKVGKLPERRVVRGVGSGSQHADDYVDIPIGLEDKRPGQKNWLGMYRAAVVRNSSLPALLGIDSLKKHNAVIRCRTGEIWFLDNADVKIQPQGTYVHCQMKQARSGHWFLPVGRFNEAMMKMEHGHLHTIPDSL